MNKNKNKPILIGALFGFVLSIILLFTQKIDSMFYFTAAPYYIDSLTLKSGEIVNIVTFIYFVVIFSLFGYLFSLRINKKFTLIALFIIAILHFVLMRLGGKTLFNGLPDAIRNAVSSESR